MYTINKITSKYTESLLLESGIRLPKNTHGVKLFCHSDLDGFFSGLFAYKQLIKQGVEPKNIKIDFVQYGDESDKKWDTKKGQALVVVDFAALPMPKEGENDNAGVRNRKWSSKDQEKLDKVRQSIVEFKKNDKWAKPPKELQDKLDELKRKKYSADFTSDHHNNSKGDLIKGTSGKIEAKPKWNNGKDETYHSDSEHIAVSYAHNIADWSTINAVSKIDHADYENLMDTLTLPTNFKNKGRMDRLANIVNTLFSALLKKNKEAAINLMRSSEPSLVSVYSNLKKQFKMNDLQIEGLTELTKEKPDWNKIDQIRKELPRNLEVTAEKAKTINSMEKFGSSNEKIEELRKKGVEDLEKSKTGYFSKKQQDKLDELKAQVKELKTKKEVVPPEFTAEIAELNKLKKERQSDFTPIGNIAMRMQDGKTDRYTGSLLSRKGKYLPFNLKRWGSFGIQVSTNPQLPEEFKERVDLVADMKKVLEIIKNKFKTKYNEWAFDIVDRNSGGHKGITTVSGLGTLGLMVKEKRENLKYQEKIKERAAKVGLDMKTRMPNHYNYMEDLKRQKEKAALERTKIMNEIEVEFYKILQEKYKDFKIPLVGMNDVKEDWSKNVNKVLKDL